MNEELTGHATTKNFLVVHREGARYSRAPGEDG